MSRKGMKYMSTGTGNLKAAAAVSAFLCAALPVSGAGAAEITSVNYGSADSMLFGERGIAVVNITDEFGDSADTTEFFLRNGNGEKLASWNGNNRSTFRKISGMTSLISDSATVSVYGSQLPDFTGDKGFVRTTEVKTGEKSTTVIRPNGLGRFEYGAVYPAETRYILYGTPERTVPVNCFAVWADKKWCTRPVDWSFVIGEYENPEDSYSSFITKEEYIVNITGGSLDLRQLPAGEYPYRIRYSISNGTGGGGGNIHNRIKIEDPDKNAAEGKRTSWKYVKKTVNLHDVFPSYFNEDGTADRTMFEDKVNFSFAEDSLNPLKTAGVFFLSGNLVSAPIPDSNGNVTLLVENETYRFTMMTDFAWKNSSGGGTTGMSGYADEKAVYDIKTVQIPEKSVPLCCLEEGEYTVDTGSIPDRYIIPDSGSFTVSNAEGSGVPECSIVLRYRRFSVSAGKSDGGTVKFSSDFTDDNKKFPVEKPVKVSAVPDSGYRIKKLVYLYENGKEAVSDSLLVAPEETFEMPYGNITVTPVFVKLVKGDVDGDDALNAADAVNMMKMILGSETEYNDSCKEAADINSDGRVNVFDLIRLNQLMTGQQNQE